MNTLKTFVEGMGNSIETRRRLLDDAEKQLEEAVDALPPFWSTFRIGESRQHDTLMGAAAYTSDLGHILEAAILEIPLGEMHRIPQSMAKKIVAEMRAEVMKIDANNPLAIVQLIQETQQKLITLASDNLENSQ